MLIHKPGTPTISFSGIGSSIQINFDLRHLSGRDKVTLCRFLLEELGILDRFSQDPDETAKAQQILTEQWNLYWK